MTIADVAVTVVVAAVAAVAADGMIMTRM